MPGAPLTRRTGAFMIDAAAALTPLWIAVPLIILLSGSEDGGLRLAAVALVPVALLLSATTHLALQTAAALRRRSTWGQRALSLTLRHGQEFPAWRRALARELGVRALFWAAAVSTGLVPLLLVDALWCMVDRQGRSLRDVLTGTRLVISN